MTMTIRKGARPMYSDKPRPGTINNEQRLLTPEQVAGLRAVIRAKSAEEMLFNAQLGMDAIPEARSREEAARFKVLAAQFQLLARKCQVRDDQLQEILRRGTCSPAEWRALHADNMRLTAEGEAIAAELNGDDD
jgi:hypothetical protein